MRHESFWRWTIRSPRWWHPAQCKLSAASLSKPPWLGHACFITIFRVEFGAALTTGVSHSWEVRKNKADLFNISARRASSKIIAQAQWARIEGLGCRGLDPNHALYITCLKGNSGTVEVLSHLSDDSDRKSKLVGIKWWTFVLRFCH